MDLASTQGFANAIWAIANLRPGSGHLTAPVCSTFVIVYFDSDLVWLNTPDTCKKSNQDCFFWRVTITFNSIYMICVFLYLILRRTEPQPLRVLSITIVLLLHEYFTSGSCFLSVEKRL